MNISNLSTGQTVKNYKAMCELLNEKEKGGKSKAYQIEEWQCHFKFSKSGHSFIIEDVYDKPKGKQTGKFGFITNIEELILDLLVQDENKGKVFLSKHRLFRELHMINDNYSYGRYHLLKLSQLINIEELDIREFYDLSRNTFVRSVENALNKLKDKSLVFWNHVRTVCVVNPRISVNDTGTAKVKQVHEGKDKFDEDIFNYEINYHVNQTHREATEDEVRFIIQTERDIMLEMNCTNKQELVRFGKWDLFMSKVKDILLDKLNILFYYDSYKIICYEDHIFSVWEELKDLELVEQERASKRLQLNSSIKTKLLENGLKRYKKSVNEKQNDNDKEYVLRRSNDEYIKNNVTLVDTLIDINHKDIRKDIKNVKVIKQK